MADNKMKGGFTIQEIEQMAKKYRFEVFFIASFVLAALFSTIFDMLGYSVLLAAAGAVIGMIFPVHADKILGQVLEFTCKQEKVTQIVIGVILIAISVVLAPVIYLIMGLVCGKALHRDTVAQKGKMSGSNYHGDSERHS